MWLESNFSLQYHPWIISRQGGKGQYWSRTNLNSKQLEKKENTKYLTSIFQHRLAIDIVINCSFRIHTQIRHTLYKNSSSENCKLKYLAVFTSDLVINNGNRTEWSPIRSEMIHSSDQQNWTAAKWESNLSIMSMITDTIGRQKVLLPINHNHYNFWKQQMHLGQTSLVVMMPKVTKFLHFGNSSVFLG